MTIFRLTTLACIFLLLTGWISLTKKEYQFSYSQEKFGRQVAKEHNLQWFDLAGGGLFNPKQCKVYAIHYIDNKKLTIEAARPLVKELVLKHWHEINNNPIYRSDLWNDYVLYKDDPQPNKKHLGFQIAYWDENIDRPLYPYLARIQVSGEEARYYYADPKTQALQDPIVEKFEDFVELPEYNHIDWTQPPPRNRKAR